MTESQKSEYIRESVLCDLNAVQPSTLPPGTLLLAVRRNYGAPVTEPELQAHLGKLANDGLIEIVRSKLSAGVVRYKITEAGTKLLIEAGLA